MTICSLHAEPGQQADGAKLKAKLRTEIDNVARHKKLQGYEIPRDFIVEFQPFSKDNHLITDSNKMARGQLKKRCAPAAQGPSPAFHPAVIDPYCTIYSLFCQSTQRHRARRRLT